MATLLDIGLFQHFSIVFSFLLVFIIIYAGLLFVKPFGESTDKGIAGLIALAVASLFLFSPSLVSMVNFIAPWFVVLFILVFFILLLYRFAGAKESSVVDLMSHWGTIHWVIMVLVIIIILAGLGQVYGPQLAGLTEEGAPIQEVYNETSRQPETFYDNVWNIIFHPRVLGLIFILIIASFVIRMMAGEK